MPLLPLKIPAGVYKTGTDYEGQGRWQDANLVRWQGGSLRPVGGWRERKDLSSTLTAIPRTLFAWVDNGGESNMAVGTASELIYVSSTNNPTDITPYEFQSGNSDAEINISYGGGVYGGTVDATDEVSLYGSYQPGTGVFQEVDTWSLDNWGEYIVGCCTSDGRLIEWNLNAEQSTQLIEDPTVEGTGWAEVTGSDFVVNTSTKELSYNGTTLGTVWTSSTINPTGYTNFELTFDVTYISGTEPVYLEIMQHGVSGYPDGIIVYTSQAHSSSGSKTERFTIPYSDKNMEVYFRVKGTAGAWFTIDDINMYGVSKSYAIPNAPTQCAGMVVTNERFIFALAPNNEARKVQWCDREDNRTWAPLATNEAGDIELQSTGRIMQGVRTRGGTLIVTTNDAHLAVYQGPPYVYGFQSVGQACGVVSRRGVVGVDIGAFWMGSESFFVFDGSMVKALPCDVQDYVFESINTNQISKVFGLHNSEYHEVWWFYPAGDSLECDRYVAYDYQEGHWHIGTINRSCGVDQGVFNEPMYMSPEQVIYEHELHGFPHGTSTPYAETAPISLGAGDNVMRITSIIPDEDTAGEVNVVLKSRMYPNAEEAVTDPLDLTTNSPTSVRITGRQVRMRVEATGNEDFRVGTFRLDATPGGKR